MIQTFLVNNTPKAYNFSINIKKGLIFSLDDMNQLITPNEMGKELTDRII
jgi:hypothetical protein